MARTISASGVYQRDAMISAAKGTTAEVHLVNKKLPPEAEAARQATRAGFVAFYRYVCQMEPAKHMAVWIEEMITEQDSVILKGIGGPHTDILAPRGSAKSTFTTFFIAWTLGIHYGPDVRFPLQIMILSYTQENAGQKSDEIRNIIVSERYKEVFPWVQPSRDLWNKKMWMLDKIHAGVQSIGSAAYTVVTAGITGSIVSKRAHIIVIDDIIKGPDAIENPTIREKMETNWDAAIRPTLMEGGRCVCLGTRFRADDMHCTKFIPKYGWLQIEQSAIIEYIDPDDEEGTKHRFSYWPERYSLQFLEQYESESFINFQFQYQNTISHAKGKGIHLDWIHKGVPPQTFDFIGIGLDLASGKKNTNDWTVFTLGGRKDNRYFLLDKRRGRWTGNITKLNVMLEMLVIWGIIESAENPDEPGTYQYFSTGVPCYLFAEKNAYQGSMAGDFKTYIIEGHALDNIIYRGVASTSNKRSRFNGITGLWENHMVYMNAYAEFSDLNKQMTNIGATQFDDDLDSMVMLLEGLRAKRRLQTR